VSKTAVRPIELMAGEYEEVRDAQDARTLALVACGHECAGERVVVRTDRFYVVAGEPSAGNLEAVLEDLQLPAEAIRQELADQARQVLHRPKHGLQDPSRDAA
jgi:hypothetical protein